MTTIESPLATMISGQFDLPCFIVAPARSGKTSLAMSLAQSHYALDEVLWVNGSVESFGEELRSGALLAYLKGSPERSAAAADLRPGRLVVIDDLTQLDAAAAERLSDCVDALVEQGRQVVVICTPEHDRYANLQSDRLLITAADLAEHRVSHQAPATPAPTEAPSVGFAPAPARATATTLTSASAPTLTSEPAGASACAHFELNGEFPSLEVRFFGGFSVWRDGERIDTALSRRSKVQALFIHLALNLERGVARESLLARLWPEKSHEAAVENFYTTWSRLGALLGGGAKGSPYISYDRQVCRLQPEYVNLDLSEFEALARVVLFCQGKREERIEAIYRMERLYRGDLLAAVHLDRRSQALQARYRSLQVDAMLAAAQLFAEIGNATTAVWFARYAYDLDPGREDVYRILMDMQDRAGQRISALRTYFDCKRYLNEELGLTPSQKTTDLYQELVLDRR